MADDSKKLEKRFVELGESLASPPSSVDELYELLDQIDGLLSSVEQSPSQTMLTALRPLMRALAVKDLLRHSDLDVKAVVASCISEITRITAPEAPYDDDNMKEIFQMIVETFEGLDKTASRSYQKRVSILETVAKVRSCVVMLDLECDVLILEMFHNFLKTIKIYHSENIFSCMETIMTLVIEESEDISTELLSILLGTLRNDKKDVLSISQRLAEKVMGHCASKIKPCLLSLVRSKVASLSEYHKVVASICQENDTLDHNRTSASCEVVADVHKFSERTSSDEQPQVSAKLEHEAACPEKVGTASDTLPVATVSNGTIQMGNGDSIEQPSSPKPKPEHSFCNGQSENVVSDHADSDNLESVAVKPDVMTNIKKGKGQKTNSSTQLTDAAGHSRVESHIGAPDGNSSGGCLTKEADGLEVDDASTKEIKPAVSSEPEKNNELHHLSGSDNPTAVALPSLSGRPWNSARPRKGRPPGSKANAKHGDVDAKADPPASRSVQKDPSVDNHTHDEMMTSKVDESEMEPGNADDVKMPASLSSDSAVKSRKGRPPGTKTSAKHGDLDAVADAPASRSVQKDPSVENHTHDELMTSKVNDSEREPEHADDVEAPASLPSDSAVKSRKGRPPGSKANAKHGDVDAVADTRASRSVQKDPSVENHTRDEMLTSKVNESEKEPEDADDVETSASLPSDSAVKSRKGQPPRSMENAKRGDVDAVTDARASRSVQKDLENHTRDEMLTSKVDESEKEPENADDVETPASLPSGSAMKPRKGRPPRSKANAKRGHVDAVGDTRASRSVQKDPLVENHTHDEILTSKVDECEKEPEDADDVEMPASLPSDSAVKSRIGRPPRSKANAKRGDVDAVADARASRSVQKDPSVEIHTRDEMLTSKVDESKKEPEDADDVETPASLPSDVETPASLPSDSTVKSRRAGKKGRFKTKAVAQESSGRKKSNTKHKKEEGATGKDVDGEPNLKDLSSSSRSTSRVHSGDKIHVDDCVVPKPRRKRAMETEDISGMPDHKKEVDESLVGSKIKVWWPDDEMFYDGIVDSYDPNTKKHKIVYADGDVEVLVLKDEHWAYVEGDAEKGGGKRKSEGNTSQMPQTKKPKASLNTMPEQAKSYEHSKSGAETSDRSSPRPRGRPKKGAFDLGKLSYDDLPETSKKSERKSASDDKAKTPRSNGKPKDVAETEPEVKTPRTCSKREESGSKSKDSTSKISEKSKDEPSETGKKSKNEMPIAITKLKVYSSKGRGKSWEDTATKDSTPRTASRSKADEVDKNRAAKTGADSKASSASSKGKPKVEENENEGPVSDGKATTGGKKRKRKGRK